MGQQECATHPKQDYQGDRQGHAAANAADEIPNRGRFGVVADIEGGEGQQAQGCYDETDPHTLQPAGPSNLPGAYLQAPTRHGETGQTQTDKAHHQPGRRR